MRSGQIGKAPDSGSDNCRFESCLLSEKRHSPTGCVFFFYLKFQAKKKETELTFCLFCIKNPENRKLILQELLVLLVLALLLVLQELLVLLLLALLQVLLVLQELLVLAQLLVLLLVLLQELQFFLHSLRKKLSLKERGRRKIFSLLDIFCCLIIDSFISSRILKKNSDFSKDYCMAEYAKYFDIPPH